MRDTCFATRLYCSRHSVMDSVDDTSVKSSILDVKPVDVGVEITSEDPFDAETEIDTESESKIEKRVKQRQRCYDYRCSFPGCDKVFPRLYRLQRHIARHNGEKPFICTIDDCHAAFACRSYLNKHMKRPHPVGVASIRPPKPKKTYKCSECDKEFKHKFDLKTHSAVHNGERPFVCTECGKSFALRGRLKNHQKSHNGYPCNRKDCDFKAIKWTELQKHVSVMHVDWLECEECGRKFRNMDKLNAHEVSHFENAFHCVQENCNKSFQTKGNLKSHVRATHDKIWFKCPQEGCSRQYRYRKSLDEHLVTHQRVNSVKESKPTVFLKRKCMASDLSGYDLSKEEKTKVLREDKLFRMEQQELKTY